MGRGRTVEPVYLPLMYNNLLVGGVPGAGKAALMSLIVAHAAFAVDCRLCLIDGKQAELGLWRDASDVFVGPDIDHAIATLAPTASRDGQLVRCGGIASSPRPRCCPGIGG